MNGYRWAPSDLGPALTRGIPVQVVMARSPHRRPLSLSLIHIFFRQAAGDLIGADADGLAHVLERILCHEVILAPVSYTHLA